MDLKLGHYTKDGIEVIDVQGEIDIYTAPRLRELLIDLVSKGSYQLIVNLDKVEPCRSSRRRLSPRLHSTVMTFQSVDTCVGVRIRSDQSVTSDASLPAVHVSPKLRKVVRPGGSRSGTSAPWS